MSVLLGKLGGQVINSQTVQGLSGQNGMSSLLISRAVLKMIWLNKDSAVR